MRKMKRQINIRKLIKRFPSFDIIIICLFVMLNIFKTDTFGKFSDEFEY